MPICSKCGEDKPADQFHLERKRKSGRTSQCKECRSEYSKEIYKGESRTTEKSRRSHLLNGYGMTEEEYLQLAKEQENKCAICSCECDRLCVDHDHKRSVNRGLLCKECNFALGLFRDDIRILESAIAYLKKDRPVDLYSILIQNLSRR